MICYGISFASFCYQLGKLSDNISLESCVGRSILRIVSGCFYLGPLAYVLFAVGLYNCQSARINNGLYHNNPYASPTTLALNLHQHAEETENQNADVRHLHAMGIRL